MDTSAKKETVLICITKAEWGGAQRYVYDLATNLPADRYDVTVSVGGEGELKDRLTAAGITVLTIKTLQRDVSVMKELRSIRALWRQIRDINPDIIHSTSSKAGFIGTALGRLSGVPKVYFTACAWAFNEDRPRWQKCIIKCIHWLTVLLSHQSAALSHGLKAQMNWPGAQKKLHVIHLGRSLTGIKTKTAARTWLTDYHHQLVPHSTLENTQDEFWIGSIAELHHVKRINIAIAAVAELIKTYPQMRYLVIHDGDERSTLEAQVRTLGLTKHVFFMGKIPDAALLIPAFDVFILPSKSEAFGYVLVEAGLAGVPVVASNVGGIPDVVIHKETGLLVPPDDPSALATAIERLLSDADYRAQLAQAHHLRSQNFTVEAMIEKTITLYQ
jgi:glycosyltransferase involved in cell wall biosynthesis